MKTAEEWWEEHGGLDWGDPWARVEASMDEDDIRAIQTDADAAGFKRGLEAAAKVVEDYDGEGLRCGYMDTAWERTQDHGRHRRGHPRPHPRRPRRGHGRGEAGGGR